MKKNGWTALLRRKQYIIAGMLVIIAVIGTTMLYSSRQEKERQQMEAELAAEMERQEQEAKLAAEAETEEAAQASAVITPETTKDTEKAEVAEETEETEETETTETTEETTADANAAAETMQEENTVKAEALHFSTENGLMWPMEGDVILNYSMDQTVYFATLDQYKYNPAVIIAGEVNDKVYSAARGQIKSIEYDEVTGCTVTVDLGDGYQAIYGQLKEPNFEVGDYVEAGHVLGYLGEPTKYFSVEGSNLYFELLKEGTPLDPVEIFE